MTDQLLAPAGARSRTISAAMDLADIQGNILLGYNSGATSYVFLTVTDAAAARSWLGELGPQLQSAQDRPVFPAVNLAVTWRGLRALGVPQARLDRLPEAFRDGMAARAALLGDRVEQVAGRSEPVDWRSPFGSEGRLHLMLMVSGDPARVEAKVAGLQQEFWQCGVTELDPPLHARHLPQGREHFGFRDGLSGPVIEGLEASRHAGSARPSVPPGEFVLGLPDVDGLCDDTEPWLTRNGSYLAIRKLEQDVAGFHRMLEAAARHSGLSVAKVAALLMGRWPDGAPLALHPETDPGWDPPAGNDFDYSADATGDACPLGAHVRRANPRGSLGFAGRLERRHQLIRRGVPYGPRFDPAAPDDGQERGLLFACYQSDLEAQFEFVQSQWLNDGNAFALGGDQDPIAGAGCSGFGLPGTPHRAPGRLRGIQPHIWPRGGEYFLVPGRRAVAHLARMAPVPGDDGAGRAS